MVFDCLEETVRMLIVQEKPSGEDVVGSLHGQGGSQMNGVVSSSDSHVERIRRRIRDRRKKR